jgi:hypothetical protein
MNDGKVLKGETRARMHGTTFNTSIFERKGSDGKVIKYDVADVNFIKFNVKHTVGKGKDRIEKISEIIYAPVLLKKRKGKKKFRLMQRLIDGKVSLYLDIVANGNYTFMGSSTIHSYNQSNLYFVQKDGEVSAPMSPETVQARLKSFKRRATDYFKDCDGLVKKIKKKEFKKKDIFQIVEFYNSNCD